MREVHVRDLLDLSESELWAQLDYGNHLLTFDDGTTHEVPICKTIISWYYWQVASNYRELEITPKLHLMDRDHTDRVHLDMMWCAIEDTMEMDIDREDVWRLTYKEVYNRLYNALSKRLIRFASPASSLEALEILRDPEIHAANSAVTNDMRTVRHAHSVVKRVLESGKYPRSQIPRAVRIGTVKMQQMLPSFGPRSQGTDVDSVIYRIPTKRGFAMEMESIRDYAKESRSAAKASLFNRDPVADAEYYSRKLQLVTSVVERLVPGDCGTTEYHEYDIPDNDFGKLLFKGIVGLYQVTDDGSPQEIRASDRHLIGTRVKFRTSLCCKHAKDQGVCTVCYGITSYAIPHDTNPGHISSTSFNKRFTQIIISTKHLDFIIHKFIAILRGYESTYLATKPDQPDSLYLSSARSGKPVFIRLQREECENLVQINYMDKIRLRDISTITSLTTADFSQITDDGVESMYLSVDMLRMATKASLSVELLEYIKREGWTSTKSEIVIDLANWDARRPLFVYQNKHESMSEFTSRTETFFRSARATPTEVEITSKNYGDHDMEELDLESGLSDTRKKSKRSVPMLAAYRDVDQALLDAFGLISEKLNDVNMGHLATMLLATRVTDPDNGDWSIPDSKNVGSFRPHDEIIRHRSLSVAMLYQCQDDVFNDISCYIQRRRPTSIMDDLIYIPPEKYSE